MKILNLSIILAVVIIGTVSVIITIILQDHLLEIVSTKPVLISKQQAIDTALKESQCKLGSYRMNSTSIVGQLFHIKNNNVFFTDDKNMQDTAFASNYLPHEIMGSEYVWEIGWDCYDATLGQYVTSADHEWHIKSIDAKSGVLLK